MSLGGACSVFSSLGCVEPVGFQSERREDRGVTPPHHRVKLLPITFLSVAPQFYSQPWEKNIPESVFFRFYTEQIGRWCYWLGLLRTRLTYMKGVVQVVWNWRDLARQQLMTRSIFETGVRRHSWLAEFVQHRDPNHLRNERKLDSSTLK